MGLGNEDKKIVFCIPERQTPHDIEQGFIRPVFEETVDGLKPIDEDVLKIMDLFGLQKDIAHPLIRKGAFIK